MLNTDNFSYTFGGVIFHVHQLDKRMKDRIKLKTDKEFQKKCVKSVVHVQWLRMTDEILNFWKISHCASLLWQQLLLFVVLPCPGVFIVFLVLLLYLIFMRNKGFSGYLVRRMSDKQMDVRMDDRLDDVHWLEHRRTTRVLVVKWTPACSLSFYEGKPEMRRWTTLWTVDGPVTVVRPSSHMDRW